MYARTAEGRLEPFDAGRISRALFAASEAVGRPDPFLARELADGVAHFLAVECEGGIPSTAQVAETTAKIVRELGQPALALAYERRRQAEPGHPCFASDLLAAHAAGLVRIEGSDDCDRLAGKALPLPDAAQAAFIALDGPEHHPPEVRAALCGATLNLNIAAPPAWARGPSGPLFGPGPDPAVAAKAARGLLDAGLPVRWHVGEDGVEEGIARRDIVFAFDRPRRAPALGYGLDRQQGAVLCRVGLGLPALAAQPGMLADAERFLVRLGSLARSALSAGMQKREHLRRIAPPFVADRALLVAVADGLEPTVRLFTGWSLANGGEALALGRRILRRLREVLRHHGRAAQMEASLELDLDLGSGMSDESQLRAASALYAEADGGTLSLHEAGSAARLREMWRQTPVPAVRFAGPLSPPAWP